MCWGSSDMIDFFSRLWTLLQKIFNYVSAASKLYSLMERSTTVTIRLSESTGTSLDKSRNELLVGT